MFGKYRKKVDPNFNAINALTSDRELDVATTFNSPVILRELKWNAVYLVEIDNNQYILKYENHSQKLRGIKRTENRNQKLIRLGWDQNAKLFVKKGIEIASMLVAYVMEDPVHKKFRLLSKNESAIFIDRINKKRQSEPQNYRGGVPEFDVQVEFRQTNTAYIMPLIGDLYACKDPQSEDEDLEVLDIVSRFYRPDFNFESFGRLIICDMFLCNLDRFYDLHNDHDRGTTNFGNFFIVDSPPRFINLDFIDTQTSFTFLLGVSWNKILNTLNTEDEYLRICENNMISLQPGSKSIRQKVARRALNELWQSINNVRNITVPRTPPPGALKQVQDGMERGLKQLQNFARAANQGIEEDQFRLGLLTRFTAAGLL